MNTITREIIKNNIPKRDPYGHKGTFGKILCVCGAVGYTGAPVLASKAAMKTGCGLVFLAVPKSIWPIVSVKSDEAMPYPVDEFDGKIAESALPTIIEKAEKCDAILIGCGLGLNEHVKKIVTELLKLDKPIILDADGINALKDKSTILLERADKVTILTPHEGEFKKICPEFTDRERDAKDFSQSYRVYLVLKGRDTLISTPDGRMFMNTTGNSGMAKGGSGDVLAGMIASLVAQGLSPLDACINGVYMHGFAGDLAAKEKTEYSMLPSDIIDFIPEVYKDLLLKI